MLIFRDVENTRKRLAFVPGQPPFLPYASHYLAMLIGRALLEEQDITLRDVSHRHFHTLLSHFQTHKARYHTQAVADITDALKACYGERDISLQQLSATFRRGDLLEMLRPTHAP